MATVARTKQIFVCTDCGNEYGQWVGQCKACQAWNTIKPVEKLVGKASGAAAKGQERSAVLGVLGESETATVQTLADIPLEAAMRTTSGQDELDRVLGGGIVAGSVVLLGGDPGIGKSTLILQTMAHLAQSNTVLYVTGEESLQQVALRAQRMQCSQAKLNLLSETRIEHILQTAKQSNVDVLVVDSIQTIYTQLHGSAPGTASQLRECTMQLVHYAKQTQTTVFLIGHVTKEGVIAGPRMLEHMVDTVLYFEGERDGRYRLLRAVKNRFGAVNEIGIFAMTETGLKPVSNPSSIFLSGAERALSGSVIMVTWEGSRPLLVEIQALTDASSLANPRRLAVGLENNRLSMLLAVLHRNTGLGLHGQDVFVNAVGGLRISETAADLAILCAIISSANNQALPRDCCIFGEVGLGGEIRPAHHGQERLQEAKKHGLKRAIVPSANMPKKPIAGLEVIGVDRLEQAVGLLTS